MSPEDQLDLELAVVGMAGRFPGADSVAAFWENLRTGVESIRDLTEEELRAAGVDDAMLAHPQFVRRAADVRDVALFDAAFFGFTPREAELTDPQFRIFLEDSWTALEDAGHMSDRHHLRIGVFAGGSAGTYFANVVSANPRAARAVGAFQTSLGNERDYLATQVSYRLDLRGPSFVVQTACSTSLVAIHLACQSLLNRECDLALAGGVSISIPQTEGYFHEEGGIASPDGRCRAFDAAAAGCVKGNGSGVVVIRRLRDALADGDSIRAVIKGTAVNNDGSAKVGFTAPSIDGQVGVIREALAVADVDPASVSYIEAHGTATALGDPIEVAALAQAFGSGPRPGRCALGSVKTNIGHLDAAAGVAGFIKAVLALQHRELPPSLHFERPHPRIDFEHLPFFVNTELRPWSSDGERRRAGVSSFGIGGTNAHVILEEAPRADGARSGISGRDGTEDLDPDPSESPQVLVLSARTESALATASAALAAWMESTSKNGDDQHNGAAPPPSVPSLRDVAFTLQVGRRRLPWRRSLVAASIPEAIGALRRAPRSTDLQRSDRRGADVAFLFPGQGAQQAGMCRSVYRSQPTFRDALDRCCEILRLKLGLDLHALLLVSKDDRAAEERLRHTAITQPALFVVEYALAQLWISWGIRPAAMAGHSIGEYVAACLAGVFSLDDALALVAERGRLMGSLPAGAMLAVQLSEADLRARLATHPALSLAVVNGPRASVAAGPLDAIDRLADELSGPGIPYRRVNTSHAFHSAMMDPILEPFEVRVRQTRRSAPSVPFLSNLTGTWITSDEAMDPAYWARHLRGTVRFADNLTTIGTDSARVLLEVGPGTTLANLARDAGVACSRVSSMPPSREDSDDAIAVLEAAGHLWAAGVDLDWNRLHQGRAPHRIPLPTYPFERQRYWVDPEGDRNGSFGDGSLHGASSLASESASSDLESNEKNPNLAEWFYLPGWKRKTLLTERGASEAAARSQAHSASTTSGAESEPACLIFDDGSELAHAIALEAASRGGKVATVRIAGDRAGSRNGAAQELQFELEPARRGAYDTLLWELRAADAVPGRVIHLWCTDPARLDPDTAQDRGFFALLNLLQAVGHSGAGTDLRIVVVTLGLFDVTGEAVECPERATLSGICRVAPQEYPGLRCRLLDLGAFTPSAPTGGAGTPAAPAQVARVVLEELDAVDREPVVARRGGHRWIPSYERVLLPGSAAAGPAVSATVLPDSAASLPDVSTTGLAPDSATALADPATVLAPDSATVADSGGPGSPGGYVFTGGAGPIEIALAQHFAAGGVRAFGFLESGPIDHPALLALQESGVEIMSWKARADDAAAVRDAIAEARARFGRLGGVFLSAHEIGGGMIQLKERGAAERVLAPRLVGARLLADLLGPDETLVLFSSAISVAGVFGQVDYCAAAAFLDAFAQAHRRTSGPRVLSIDWGVSFWDRWQSTTGAGAEALVAQLREIQSSIGITVPEGVDALSRVLPLEVPQVIVTTQDLDELVAQSVTASMSDILEGVGSGSRRDRTGPGDGLLESETERRVAVVWADLLGVGAISRSDNFFDLGGNSLLAIQLASQLRKEFDIDLTIASLFESADLASLAGAVDRALEERNAAEEIARLLDEIEHLSDQEVRAELERGTERGATD